MKQIDDILLPAKDELDIYIDLLKKWQKALNLVAPSTLSYIWDRHILDSAQLYPLLSKKQKILVDMGSGAGFPALVLAILNKKNNGKLEEIHLIESDNKKCIFLQEVIRKLSLSVTVHNQRLEKVKDLTADVVTARALADLSQLFIWGKSFIKPQTTCLFLKGEHVDQELVNLPVSCQIKKIKSVTNSNSYIIKATEVFYD